MSVHGMIAHLTSRPAKRLGIFPQRGLIATGAIADIVVFDLKRIKDAATFDRPKQRSEGIEWVFVNGVPVIEKGEMTGQRPGRTVRRRPDGSVGS
jgi:N-acyl-D-aspartate/D-glutamate deacylase